jgi:hypothetical protein
MVKLGHDQPVSGYRHRWRTATLDHHTAAADFRQDVFDYTISDTVNFDTTTVGQCHPQMLRTITSTASTSPAYPAQSPPGHAVYFQRRQQQRRLVNDVDASRHEQ